MPRHSLLIGALLATTLIVANGCRSCSSCHDYDPPVANCQCGHCPQCGCNGGSACGCQGSSACDCNGGSACGCNGDSSASGTVMEGGYTQDGEVVEGVPSDRRMYIPQSANSN